VKRIIKNRVYDTTKAKRLAEYEPNPYHSDFHWYCETLFQKRTGEYFLHGDGNAASKYSKNCGQNEWCGDEKIIPLTYEEARQWAEERLDTDNYIGIFGEPAEDDSVTALNLTLSSASVAKFKAAAQQQQISQRELMEKLIGTL
jgi:hypothetical protein